MAYEVVTDVKCPFCGLPIMPWDYTADHGIPTYACVNPNCEESEDLIGTLELWIHLVVVSDEMKKLSRKLKNAKIKTD